MILGAAELTSENITEAFELFTDSDRSFILTSSEPEVLSAAFLTRVASSAMKLPGYVQLNYLQLILKHCPHGDLIWRMGGDGGDQQVSIQVFAPREEKPALVSHLRSLAATLAG